MEREYEGLREALHPALRYADDDILAEELDDSLVAAVESFGSALRTVGQYARQAAPGAVQGALTGMQVGGPWGALIGAGAGAALGSRMPGVPGGVPAAGLPVGGATATPITNAMPIPMQPTATLPNPAALQLLALLFRPEVIYALQALALGPKGAPTVSIGHVDVPVAAIANSIGALSEIAAAQHHVSSARVERHGRAWERHLERVLGETTPASAARTSVLLALLADSEPYDEDHDEVDDPADLQDLMDLYRLESDR